MASLLSNRSNCSDAPPAPPSNTSSGLVMKSRSISHSAAFNGLLLDDAKAELLQLHASLVHDLELKLVGSKSKISSLTAELLGAEEQMQRYRHRLQQTETEMQELVEANETMIHSLEEKNEELHASRQELIVRLEQVMKNRDELERKLAETCHQQLDMQQQQHSMDLLQYPGTLKHADTDANDDADKHRALGAVGFNIRINNDHDDRVTLQEMKHLKRQLLESERCREQVEIDLYKKKQKIVEQNRYISQLECSFHTMMEKSAQEVALWQNLLVEAAAIDEKIIATVHNSKVQEEHYKVDERLRAKVWAFLQDDQTLAASVTKQMKALSRQLMLAHTLVESRVNALDHQPSVEGQGKQQVGEMLEEDNEYNTAISSNRQQDIDCIVSNVVAGDMTMVHQLEVLIQQSKESVCKVVKEQQKEVERRYEEYKKETERCIKEKDIAIAMLQKELEETEEQLERATKALQDTVKKMRDREEDIHNELCQLHASEHEQHEAEVRHLRIELERAEGEVEKATEALGQVVQSMQQREQEIAGILDACHAEWQDKVDHIRDEAQKRINELIQATREATSYVTISTYNAAKTEWSKALMAEKKKRNHSEIRLKDVEAQLLTCRHTLLLYEKTTQNT